MSGSKRSAEGATLRFLTKRRILAAFGGLVIVLVTLIVVLASYLNSDAFGDRVRHYIVDGIEQQTGAKVTLRAFSWNYRQQRIRLDDLTLRGLESSDHAPLVHFTRIDIGLNFRTLFERRIDLFELTFDQPELHVSVTPDGKTNFPFLKSQPQQKPSDFKVSVKNFNVINGSAVLNERRIDMDFSLKNLSAILVYHADKEVLEAHLGFDGVLEREPGVKLAIPYTLNADMDYTRATLVAHHIAVTSGQSEMKLQGRINDVLSRSISGKLAYTGNTQVRFLNYFFTDEKFAGKATATGSLEFSDGYFFTQGKTISDAVDYDGWRATGLSGEYSYRFPDRQLSFNKLKTTVAGGTVSGNVVVEQLPGPSRVILDLDYAAIDAAAMTRAYPWDPKYRIFSKATGKLGGWFEGKLVRFDLSGHADLKSYPPGGVAGVVALPLDGSADYQVRPEETLLSNADVRFYSTAVKAGGLISAGGSIMKIDMTSSNLKDLAFLYPDANGSGSFNGSLSGQIAKPVLNGEFTLQNHAYRQWKIQQASGGVRLDLPAGTANLRNVQVTQGESHLLVNGSAALSAASVDLRVQANHVTAQDLRPFVKRDIGGIFAADLHVTALKPNLKFEGDVQADSLSVDNRSIGNARAHVRYFEPLVDLQQVVIRQNDSTLTGNAAFNHATDAVKFTARVSSINLEMLKEIGLPDSVQGIIRQADLRGDGTTTRPNISGTAAVQNLSVLGEVFPQVRLDFSSKDTTLTVALNAGRGVTLNADIDTAAKGYPFNARASFTQYPVERIAKFSQGTISATGIANLTGVLAEPKRLRGNGRIESTDIRIKPIDLRATKPFTFEFNSESLTLNDAALSGESTEVILSGTIGLAEQARLDLKVDGKVDLGLIAATYPAFTSAGAVNMQVQVGGTVQTPNLSGQMNLVNGQLGRKGLFMNLSNVNGRILFTQDQIRVDNVQGQVGGGTVSAQGTALLQSGAIQNMNIQIAAGNIRLRGYPAGLRTVVDAPHLVLRNTWAAPLLEGNVQIKSLRYVSSFEDFLALMTEENLNNTSSLLGRLRLNLHVEGGKDITIQNQLADVEARVDIDLKGTVAEPAVTGHVEASGGSLLFQGNRYTLTRGNIDFVDPLRIQPVIDIEAESQVRDYRVILSITGRGDSPKLKMRSEPPLPELEIVSLIAGGRTRDEIAVRSTSAVPTSEQLFQSGAASILSDLLQQRVGNRLGLLNTSRVRIEPFQVGAVNNSGARITLSQQVTKELSVTYSQDLSSNRQQVIQVEYFVGRNTSVVASRDELGNFGLDLRQRIRIK